MITIHGSFNASSKTGEFKERDANLIVSQIARDATCGTFGEFSPEYLRLIGWNAELEQLQKKWARVSSIEPVDTGGWRFSIELDESLYPPDRGGARHLVGVLAGDLFSVDFPEYEIDDLRITKLEWQSYLGQIAKASGKNRTRISQIRDAFKLGLNEPLLAFSLKPRIGLAPAAIKSVAMDVFRGGFQIVELDTRCVAWDEKEMQDLVDLSGELAELGRKRSKIWRLSLNLTITPGSPSEWTKEIMKSQDPAVIKVDGGLDGLAVLEEIRSEVRGDPIVTCYPLLTRVLSSRLPNYGFTDLLAASGADIIYPGGCPQLGEGWRNLDHVTLLKGLMRYRSILQDGATMPTVAGGIHAGQIPAYYELLGPDVAYFVGGGVALHKKGASAGAKLCRSAVNGAMAARTVAPEGKVANDVESRSVKASQNGYYKPEWMPKDRFMYVSARQLLGKYDGLVQELWFNKVVQ